MAERQRRELNPGKGGKARVRALGDERPGQLEIGNQRQDLEQNAEHRQEGVDRRQDVQRLVGTTDLGTTKYSTMKPASNSSARWRTVRGNNRRRLAGAGRTLWPVASAATAFIARAVDLGIR